MSSTAYIMITVARVDPGFLDQALHHTGTLAGDLKTGAGALTARYGVLSTGDHAGSLVLFQGYDELNGIDRAFDVYSRSDGYQALIGSGKVQVALRNIVKVEDVGLENGSTDLPAYGVLTRWGSRDPMVDKLAAMTHHFEDNGAMFLRYGTIMTGVSVGRRLMGVGYPSMDAIEKTYGALRGDPGYGEFLADVDLDFRNIFRYAGEA